MSSSDGVRKIFEAFPRQDEFARAVWSGQFRYLLYGGAIGGGKTYVSLAILFALCRIFPGSRWAIVRKDLPTMRRTIIPSFERLRPRGFIEPLNWQQMNARCANGSEILFMPESIKQDPNLDRFAGLEVNGFILEEASELSEAMFFKAIERAGRWAIEGASVQPPVLVLLTCNPSQSWVKKTFFDPWSAGTLAAPYFYLPAKITDNPHLSAGYIESIKYLPPETYRRVVEGDWTVADDPLAVIPYEDLRACLVEPDDLETALEGQTGETLGIDVGELGSDPTALAYMRGSVLYEIETFSKKRTDESKAIILPRIAARGIPAERIGVDAGGVGAGLYGGLHEAGLAVQRIMFGASPREVASTVAARAFELQYKDLGTQMYWSLRQRVQAREIAVLNHPGLVQDLVSRQYRTVNDRTLRLVPKSEMRAILGRSPDMGDAAVICNFVRELGELVPVEVRSGDTGEVHPGDSPRSPLEVGDDGSVWGESIFGI